MIDLLAMWKSKKMIAIMALTAVLYAVLVIPFQVKIFGGHGDFGRVGIGVVSAFSLLFGPAAAWGAAIGAIIRDAATSGLDIVTPLGFIANFLLGYIPYKLWNALSSAKPDLRNLKKIGLFIGVNLVACAVCGVVIASALYWLNVPAVPFMPTSLIIAVSDAVWAVLLGSVILALSYRPVEVRRLHYGDVLGLPQKLPQWTKKRTAAVAVFAVCTALCFLSALTPIDPLILLLPAALSVVAIGLAMR